MQMAITPNAFQTIVSDGIAEVTFDLFNSKVNKLSSPVMAEFAALIEQLGESDDLRMLVLRSAKPGIFIAGADIAEIDGIVDAVAGAELCSEGHRIFNALSALRFPTLAVIDGVCLGGGLELALACSYRIATDSPATSIGLPEVNLGIMPGFGGTQRLPRLIGLTKALSMILTGKPIDGKKAARFGVVDACVAAEFVEERTAEFIKKILTPEGARATTAQRNKQPIRRWLTEGNALSRMVICRAARKNLMKKTKGQYPAPLRALDVIASTIAKPLDKGLAVEAQAFAELAVSPISKHLVNLFYLSEDLKKDPGAVIEGKPRKVESAGVLGAGVMGGGIAWNFTKIDVPVRLKDLDWLAIGKGYEAAADIYGQLKKLRKYDQREIDIKMHHLSGTTDFSGFGKLDIVVEAIVEDLDVKRKVFAELAEHVRDDTIIASNTSTLPISDMADAVPHPERFIGMHFFNPVNRMPLVEVIPGKETSPETVAAVVALCKRLKKTPIVVQSCPGFLVNRLLLPYLNEAVMLLQDGVDPEEADRVMAKFGMPMGPFVLLDEVGIDVAHKCAVVLADAYGERMANAPLLGVMYQDHCLLGKKSGRGFYVHEGKKKAVNPQLSSIVADFRETHCLKVRSFTRDDIVDRCMLTMINEAARALDEEIVASPAHLDMAMIMGTGFPPFRGGLLRYADELGAEHIVDRLRSLADQYGDRFAPCERLQSMTSNNARFYDETLR
jgi:3-hydroxyacyl-CoA dehydrogenase/enoyl-CoA hydratase/3-hydroxybutyryl-CoA epimerase